MVAVSVVEYNNCCFKVVVGYDIVTKYEMAEMVSLIRKNIARREIVTPVENTEDCHYK